jgi:hypothetical protein
MAKKKKKNNEISDITTEFLNTWTYNGNPCKEISATESINCNLFNDTEMLTRTVLVEKIEKNNWKINILDYADEHLRTTMSDIFKNSLMMSYIFKHININDNTLSADINIKDIKLPED